LKKRVAVVLRSQAVVQKARRVFQHVSDSNMDIQYALILWASWVKNGRARVEFVLADHLFPRGLKHSEKSLAEAVDETVLRLPGNLRQTIKAHYLDGQTTLYAEALGPDRTTFQRRLGFAEHLIASTIFED
jgi:hypothetical protein